jgi:hypothetical protein
MTFLSTCRWWLAGAGVAMAGLGAAGSAQARDVTWSVGIGAPGAQVIVGNAPVYVAPPVVVHAPRYYRAPERVYYGRSPAPVYYGAPVVVAPPGYYQPRSIYYGPPAHFHGHRHGRGHGHKHHRRHRGHD